MPKSKTKPKIYIGTSGWTYPHWKENFFPEKLPVKKWLPYYSEHFQTVEVNTTFYHLPLITTIQNWNLRVPENFIFSIKASRYITHLKRLKDCQESVELFLSIIKGLKVKLGPILFQLPPSFKMDKERLEEFITYLSPDYKYVFEFRHDSWYVEDIYTLLREHNNALCITDLKGKQTPEVITADFTYIRLHGPKKAYTGSYGPTRLKTWKKKISNWNTSTSVYCYFDNDDKGAAIQDALNLKKIL